MSMGHFEYAARRRAFAEEVWAFLLREQELRKTKDDARFSALLCEQDDAIDSLVTGGAVLRLVWEGFREARRS